MKRSEMPDLAPEEMALARSHTYALLSRLYQVGLTAELRPYALALLGTAVPEAFGADFDADQAAAAHYGLFSLDLFPFQSIFRDAAGLLGGEESAQVRAAYAEAGYYVDAEADHVGQELAFLAFLCGAEAEAPQDGPADAARARARQKRFLEAHLLSWLPPFTAALGHTGQPFYAALGELTLAFVADHAAALGPELVPGGRPLPAPPALLAEARTSLKDIAAQLVTPPSSGLYLGRGAIGRLGRAHRLPRGFGGRQQMLANLLHTAVQYDSLDGVLGGLTAVVQEWQTTYANQTAQHPHLVPFIAVWQERLRATAQLLNNMQVQIEALIKAET